MTEAVKAAMTAAASSARASAATTSLSTDRQIRASTSPSSKDGADSEIGILTGRLVSGVQNFGKLILTAYPDGVVSAGGPR